MSGANVSQMLRTGRGKEGVDVRVDRIPAGRRERRFMKQRTCPEKRIAGTAGRLKRRIPTATAQWYGQPADAGIRPIGWMSTFRIGQRATLLGIYFVFLRQISWEGTDNAVYGTQ